LKELLVIATMCSKGEFRIRVLHFLSILLLKCIVNVKHVRNDAIFKPIVAAREVLDNTFGGIL
jgi:hypothetical protein